MEEITSEKSFGAKKTQGPSPTQTIVLAFLALVLVGALLLMLPFASRSGGSCGFRTALFTSTTSVCITGLVLGDTWSMWTGFGQAVILILIEIGGLGFMSATALIIFLFHRKIGLRQRMVMAQSMGLSDLGGVVRMQRWVLKSSLYAQLMGFLVLFFHFLPNYSPLTALKVSLFHSVSAYCNAGLDIFGFIDPGASLVPFSGDPVLLLTLSVLIIYGGLGFPVLEQVFRLKHFSKYNVYAKVVLIATASLLLFGTVTFCFTEWNNPDTLGTMPLGEKILGAFFQSVTSRTAGYAAIDQGSMTEAGKAVTCVLMMIGGASSSTAGGIKVGSFFVIMLFILARTRGHNEATIFKRTISNESVLDAVTITFIMFGLALFGCVFISVTSHVSLAAAMFEAVSALSNTGLSTVGTGNLSVASQILLIIYMFFGRVGVITISLSFLMRGSARERIHYADTKILIG